MQAQSNEDIRQIQCPACGGAFKIEQMQGEYATCQYCGQLVQLPKEPEPPQPTVEIHFEPRRVQEYVRSTIPVSYPTTKKKTGWIGWVAALFILFFAVGVPGIAIFSVLREQGAFKGAGGVLSPQYSVHDGVVLVPNEDQPEDILLPVYYGGLDTRNLIYLNGSDRTARWEGTGLGEEWYQVKVLSNLSQIFLLKDNVISAYSREDGHAIWQTTLNIGIGNCSNCFQLFGNSMAVLEKDGSVQGLDVETGNSIWNMTLNNTYLDLLPVSKYILVEETLDSGDSALQFYNPQTGELVKQITEGCDGAADQLDEYSLSEDGNILTIFYFDNCVEQVDTNTLEVIQKVQYLDQDLAPSAWFATNMYTIDERIYFVENGSTEPVIRMDLQTGEFKTLVEDNKFDLLPIREMDDVLLVDAEPTYDSEQKQVWGVDRDSGTVLWQAQYHQPSGASESYIHPVGKNVFILDCIDDEPEVCNWKIVDLHNGSVIQAGTAPGDVFVEETWGKDSLYLVADGKMSVIRLADGQVEFQLP